MLAEAMDQAIMVAVNQVVTEVAKKYTRRKTIVQGRFRWPSWAESKTGWSGSSLLMQRSSARKNLINQEV